MIDETQRQLDYIDGQLARGDRDPKDVQLLKARRAELIEQRDRKRGVIANFRDRLTSVVRRSPHVAHGPVTEHHTIRSLSAMEKAERGEGIDARRIAKEMASAARAAAEKGGDAA